MSWLKHAFAVEPKGPYEPNDQQKDVVERMCREVVRRRMTTPALMFLEMCRPLNFLGSQAMHFFRPILAVVADTEGLKLFADFLEHRGSIDYLCRRIEAIEAGEGEEPESAKHEKEDKSEDTGDGSDAK